jgi:hypothetical protein
MHVSEGSINHKTILPVDAESYNFENHWHLHLLSHPLEISSCFSKQTSCCSIVKLISFSIDSTLHLLKQDKVLDNNLVCN